MLNTLSAMLLFANAHSPIVAGSALPCVHDTFSSIALHSTHIRPISASMANVTAPKTMANFWPIETPISVQVCNATVQYTHLGWNDTINTFVHLPVSVDWNVRLLGTGGSGWATGQIAGLVLPATKGFVSVATDGGHSTSPLAPAADWVLAAKVNINWNLLNDFASVALDDAAILGKEAVAAFYGSRSNKIYFFKAV
ncbi:hypothetical protein IWW34DRAFT_781008 [Fusarium oxysporum f. sp. albedinis]|nr:hypothetical protein IWW34DRAFT_781008 [Fusarium oxysporum f. sp. albedinis]KAJ0150146.1 Uncharacterized protein HZ326_7375 [Fusarium oxysporum f. sp. albedinis]KAK2482320.1 hypothetical protein H9L39_04112 [Fusarium oxysporum f. sp. albedinis]